MFEQYVLDQYKLFSPGRGLWNRKGDSKPSPRHLSLAPLSFQIFKPKYFSNSSPSSRIK